MFIEIKNKYLRITSIFFYLVILFFCALQLNFLWLFGFSPSYKDIKRPSQQVGSELYTADGKLIGRYYRENRTPITYQDITPSAVNALIAREDARFYNHFGIDFFSLLSSGVSTATGDKRGASTITQQLAKNLYRTRYNKSQGITRHIPLIRTLIPKLKEWMTAIKLESNYSKEDIITMYLNTVSFGNNAYGIKTASRVYFDKEAIDLTVPESALLIGLLKATTSYNPFKFPERAIENRNITLSQMNKYKFLSEADMKKFQQEKLILKPGNNTESADGDSYLRAAVDKYLAKWCEENNYDLYEDGLKIYTTIDSKLQKYAEEAMTSQMRILQNRFKSVWGNEDPWEDSEGNKVDYAGRAVKSTELYKYLNKKYDNQPDSVDHFLNLKKKMKVFTWYGDRDTSFSTIDSIKYYGKILNTGMMTLDPFNGKIKVWIGGINNKYFKYDHVNQSKRQAGSTFKPFVYLAALQSGMSPCDTFEDKPVRIAYKNAGKTEYWEPKNADHNNTYQAMSLRWAMGKSVNTITAQLTEKVGPENVVKWANECGIESPLTAVPSVGLGSNDVSVYEMVRAYGTFLNNGVRTDPILVEKITDLEDNIIEEFTAKTKRVLSEEIAWLMLYMFRGGMEEPGGTSQALWGWDLFKKNNQIGGKTGTSSDYVDGWYMGITKDLVTGIWIGCDERTAHFQNSAQGEGSRTALPMFAKFMEKVYNDPNSGYTYGQFPKSTVKITRKFDCPSPRISIDTNTVDSLLIDSLDINLDPVTEQIIHQIQDERPPTVIKEQTNNNNITTLPKPVTTNVPLSNKEERELKRKQRQEEKEKRKNN